MTVQLILTTVLLLSALGVILARKPVHACLSFLVTLLSLAALFLELSAEFVAVLQVLVYAGAILVLFMFVIVLFQDAYLQIDRTPQKSFPPLIYGAIGALLATLLYFGKDFVGFPAVSATLPANYGTVQALGKALYLQFFFPFEAITLLFLVAVIGAFYIGKKWTYHS